MIHKIFKENNLIYYFFIFYFLIGFFIYKDYGISWDEPISRTNGFVSLNYIFELLNFDKYDGYGDFLTYRDNYYGVVFDLPLAILEKLFSIETSKNYYHLRHLSTFIIFFISSIYFYYICKKFYDFKLCILGILIYITMPRIFAESFYNSKDIVFLSLFTISNYYLITFFQKKSLFSLINLSLSIGLLVGIRVVGIIVPLLAIFFIFIESLDKKIFNSLVKIIIFLLLVTLFTYIFSPYLWANLIDNFLFSFNTMKNYQWSGSVFYFGNYEVGRFMPWHYSLVMILSTIPVLYLLLFFIGYFLTLKVIFCNFINLNKNNGHVWKNNLQLYNQISFFIITFTILSIIEFNSTLYGGWRQIYFLYLPISFLALNGIQAINYKYKFFSNLLFPLYIVIVIFWIFNNHPYQYTYYNYPFSKIAKKNFELDYWGVSNYDVLKYLLINYERDVYKIYVFSISPYNQATLMFGDENKSKFVFTKDIDKAEFIVSNHYYQDDKDPVKTRYFLDNKYRSVYNIKVNNIAINTLYEKKSN